MGAERVPVFAFALFLVVALNSSAFGRKWTDATGGFSVEAELVGTKDGIVQLKKSDGQIVSVPLEKLSEADRTHLDRLTKPAAKASDATVPQDRQSLLAALLKRAKQSTQTKHSMYTVASWYAPDDAEIKAKIKETKAKHNSADGMRTANLLSEIGLRGLTEKWPGPTPEMEITELRLILDKDLTGSLDFMTLMEGASASEMKPVPAIAFTAKPNLTVAKVLKKYGTPSQQTKASLTYGRIRLLVDPKSDKVLIVAFRTGTQ